jgi:hypothetical protein
MAELGAATSLNFTDLQRLGFQFYSTPLQQRCQHAISQPSTTALKAIDRGAVLLPSDFDSANLQYRAFHLTRDALRRLPVRGMLRCRE